MLLPVALPRKLTALRFTSLLSFVLSLVLVFTIFALSFDKDATTRPGNPVSDRMSHALKDTHISLIGIFNSLPLIIFSYMYQPNIPALYQELKKRHIGNMQKVLVYGTLVASLAYIMAGMFGYITFAMYPSEELSDIMQDQNILKAPYAEDKYIVKFCLVSMLVVVLFASPFTVLPAKDSFEELLMKEGQRFTSQQNFMVSFLIVLFSYGVALLIP